MERVLPQQPNYLEAFIKTAQYLSGLMTTQDVWTESQKLLVSFWGADFAGFGERRTEGDIVVANWTYRDENGASIDLVAPLKQCIEEVLDTGFLSSRLVSKSSESFSFALLPVSRENQVIKVLMVGHRITTPLPKDLLNTYLAVASLVGTTAARLTSEAELRKHRQHLQKLVDERTAQLMNTNAQLQREIEERRRAEARTEHLNRVLRAISNVDQIIVKEKDPGLLLQRICETLIETRGYYHAWIAWEGSPDVFLASADRGSHDEYLSVIEQLKRGELPECHRSSLARPERLLTHHPTSICNNCPLASGHDGRGGMTARLDYGGKLYGFLTVSLPAELVGDRDEEELLSDVAGDIAFALHDVELEQEGEKLRVQLMQAQKAEAVGTLTAGLAHDFNNLLQVINGYTELILSEKTEDDPSYSDLEIVLKTGRKGAELVQRLLSLSKKGEYNPQSLDLNCTVEDSVGLMRGTFPKMIEIEEILEKPLSMVNADAGQLSHVLMNLCINAKEAMPEGGKLRIETRNAIVDEEYCGSHPGINPGRHVLVEISDTGKGMSQETIERMFDPFYTTKGWDFNKGTGLGLSVAKGIVEQHRGWITCQSQLGAGTKFSVYFPAIEDSSVVSEPEPQAESFLGTYNILLVDDEEYVRDLGKRILERAGYTVITASNGKEALEVYGRDRSTIALVVLDLMMPQMAGETCLEELLKIDPKAIVVVSSGHPLTLQAQDRLRVHAKGFVDKPYEVKQLLQVVGELL